MAAKPNPLLMALSRRNGPQPDIKLPDPPRTLEVSAAEAPNAQPGTPIHLEIDGRVRSVTDGKAVIEILQVSSEAQEPEGEQPQ